MTDLSSRFTRLTSSPGNMLRGRCEVPGDKSLSHRAIIMAAMAQETSTLNGLGNGEDVQRTLRAVEAFGAKVLSQGRLTHITGSKWRSPETPIDCGNSATAAKLLIGAAAAMPGLRATFIGDESLSRRPMNRIIEPLIRVGAKIESVGDTLPVRIIGRRLSAITHRNVPASAQVKTALLLAAAQASGITRIIEPVRSRTHGEVLLGQFGGEVDTSDFGGSYSIALRGPQELRSTRIDIGGDPSSAAYPIVAGLLVPGSRVEVDNMIASPERMGLFDILPVMGANIELRARQGPGEDPLVSVTSRHSRLRGVDVPANMAPTMIDEYPIAAIAAAFAAGTTIFRGLGELRHKECDRLERLRASLHSSGVSARIEGDDLVIRGGRQPHGNCLIRSHGDHRIAMAFAVLGLASNYSVVIEDADKVRTSFPGFGSLMSDLGASLHWSP